MLVIICASQVLGIVRLTLLVFWEKTQVFAAFQEIGQSIMNLSLVIVLVARCGADDCDAVRDSFGAASNEYRQCVQRGGGGGGRSGGGGGYGGGNAGGGYGGGGNADNRSSGGGADPWASAQSDEPPF